MRSLSLLVLWTVMLGTLTAQPPDPVKWSFSVEAPTENVYEVAITAEVEPGWYLYSQYLESDMGPIPTSFHFDAQDGLELVGNTAEEGQKLEGYDALFDMTIAKYAGEVRFTQTVRAPGQAQKITGYLEFMTCNDEVCLPPREVEFSVELKK